MESKTKSQVILFNKPFGVVSQFSGDQHEQTLAAFIKRPGFYPAGRLDKNSEGLLLLTNDGSLQHELSHPKFHKKKHYWVQVEGIPTEESLEILRNGLSLKDQSFLPAQVQIITEPKLWPRQPPIRFRQNIPTTWLEMIIKEGKNHQIRRMTASIGYPTLRLVRVKIGSWELGELQPGEYLSI